MKKLKEGAAVKGSMAGAIGEAAGAAVSEREYERLKALQVFFFCFFFLPLNIKK